MSSHSLTSTNVNDELLYKIADIKLQIKSLDAAITRILEDTAKVDFEISEANRRDVLFSRSIKYMKKSSTDMVGLEFFKTVKQNIEKNKDSKTESLQRKHLLGLDQKIKAEAIGLLKALLATQEQLLANEAAVADNILYFVKKGKNEE